MTRGDIYDRLRAIGCTCETADAMAEALEGESDKKIEAFILWVGGLTEREVAMATGIPKTTFHRFVDQMRKKIRISIVDSNND